MIPIRSFTHGEPRKMSDLRSVQGNQTWRNGCLILSAFLLASSASATAQDSTKSAAQQKQAASPNEQPTRKRAVNPAMVAVQETPGLPRVLLIGDSISIGYTVPVRKLLNGKANVIRPLTNCGPSSRGIEQIDQWLGDGKWDVIHFNFGLHDLVYYSADGKKRLVDPASEGARHQVSLEQYEQNLQTLVARMKKTGAVLIWCSTTPVPEGAPGRKADEAIDFNKVALKVMNENNVLINDLHAFAASQLADIQLPKNVHFSPAGSQTLAEQVVRAISPHLK